MSMVLAVPLPNIIIKINFVLVQKKYFFTKGGGDNVALSFPAQREQKIIATMCMKKEKDKKNISVSLVDQFKLIKLYNQQALSLGDARIRTYS